MSPSLSHGPILSGSRGNIKSCDSAPAKLAKLGHRSPGPHGLLLAFGWPRRPVRHFGHSGSLWDISRRPHVLQRHIAPGEQGGLAAGIYGLNSSLAALIWMTFLWSSSPAPGASHTRLPASAPGTSHSPPRGPQPIGRWAAGRSRRSASRVPSPGLSSCADAGGLDACFSFCSQKKSTAHQVGHPKGAEAHRPQQDDLLLGQFHPGAVRTSPKAPREHQDTDAENHLAPLNAPIIMPAARRR